MIFNASRHTAYSVVIMSVCLCLASTSFSQLSQRNILSNKVSIKLPASFTKLDSITLASKYPPNNNLSEVYTNEEATVNVAFRSTQQQLIEEDVITEGKKLENQLVNNGKVVLIKSEEIKTTHSNIHVFSFYSNAVDAKIYNVMFVFSANGKMIVGSFNCTSVLQPQWQQSAYEIIRSIKPN